MLKSSLIGACSLLALALPAAAADNPQSDAGFAQKITMHHQMGIEMAQLCQDRASHSELKTFCSKTSTEMQDDTQQLAALGGAGSKAAQSEKATTGSSGSSTMKTGSSSVSPEMKAIHDEHQKAMTELKSAQGNDFDRQFVSDMARHHEEGMKDLQECQSQAASSDLKKLCQKMAAGQQSEVKQLRQWQSAWSKS